MYISLFHLASQNTTGKQVNQKVSQEATESSMNKSSSDQWW